MEAHRFDSLVRSLTTRSPRRRFLGMVLASVVAMGARTGSDETRAKKGKGKGRGQRKGNGKGNANRGGQRVATGGAPPRGRRTRPRAANPASPTAAACTLPTESCDGCCQDGQCRPGTVR